MRKILYVIPGLEYGGAATQIRLLVRGLPRDEFVPRVCGVGGAGPAAEAFRAAGVPVDELGGTRLVNLAALWRLRRLVRDFQPDVIHAWGRPALRAVVVAAGRLPFVLVASSPFTPRKSTDGPHRLDRWLLSRVNRMVASGYSESERWQSFGLPPHKLVTVPPGVEGWSAASGARSAASNAQRFVLSAGPLEPHKGFLDAIWAFDILQFLYQDLHLRVVGAGSDRGRLERFAELTGAGQRVHFAGVQTQLADLLDRAAVVWIPSRAEGGINLALEAMVRGRPVVASRLPGLAEIITDGATGLLVTPGDKVELARQTRRLLDDADLCRRLGEAARHRAATHFTAADLVRRCADLYRVCRRAA